MKSFELNGHRGNLLYHDIPGAARHLPERRLSVARLPDDRVLEAFGEDRHGIVVEGRDIGTTVVPDA